MGFLDGLEKLINEHGSAAILRERIIFLNEQHAVVVKQVGMFEQQVSILQHENKSLELDNSQLQEQIRNLEIKLSHDTNPLGHVCDHCGSPDLKRTGNRPDPVFFDLGAKQAVFSCNSCGKESAFELAM